MKEDVVPNKEDFCDWEKVPLDISKNYHNILSSVAWSYINTKLLFITLFSLFDTTTKFLGKYYIYLFNIDFSKATKNK